MLSRLVTWFIVFAITISGFTSHAYAVPNNLTFGSSGYSTKSPVVINSWGTNNSFSINNSFNSYGEEIVDKSPDPFTNEVADGFLSATGTAVGATIACYVVDGVISMFVPPAAALAPGCLGAGTIAGGASAIAKAH